MEKSLKEKYEVICSKVGTLILAGKSQGYSLMAKVLETLLSNAVSLALCHSSTQTPSLGSLFSLAFKPLTICSYPVSTILANHCPRQI